MILLFTMEATNGQALMGFEGYCYSGGASTLVPKLYYQSSSDWYGEARYNYETGQTFSIFAGRTFSKQAGQETLSYSFTPMAGILAGKLRGGSVGMNAALDLAGLSFYSETEYIVSAGNRNGSFLLSWTECGWHPTGWLYLGLALQQTGNSRAPGMETSISRGRWRFPLYVFDCFSDKRYLVLGISREWQYSKRITHQKASD
jgi:hypothetical protein